jgi:uncharacterized membrane protein YfcA
VIELAALCAFAFLAGLVDAIAGGGGLIQVPALFAFFPGAPPSLLLGTNKLSSIAGTTIATVRYSFSVPIKWPAVLPAAVIAGISAGIGAQTVRLIDPAVLRPVLMALLSGVLVYTLMRPALGARASAAAEKQPDTSGFYFASAIFGFYDGFFGPGAGSLMMFALVRWFGYDFVRAAATTKVLNVFTNTGALVLFAWTGNVIYAMALPMAACNLVGGFLGAHFAIRRGSRFIRLIFLVVAGALLGKVLLDLLRPL